MPVISQPSPFLRACLPPASLRFGVRLPCAGLLGLVLLLATVLIPIPRPAQAVDYPKNLTVVLDNDYPPYVFPAPDGGFQGILVDLWKLWEQKTGVPVTLRPMPWQAAQQTVLSGKADVIDMRRLETETGRSRAAIIALTAHAFEEHRQRSLAAGCDDFQIKPIPKAKLLDLLATWMAVRPA